MTVDKSKVHRRKLLAGAENPADIGTRGIQSLNIYIQWLESRHYWLKIKIIETENPKKMEKKTQRKNAGQQFNWITKPQVH